MRLIPALALTALALPALADGVMTEGNTLATPPTEWLGETAHFVAMGTVNGQPLDIQYLDIATADVAAFQGKREYLPGEGGAWLYGDFEVALEAVIGGVERSIEIEIENRDFAAHTLPASFTFGTENFPESMAAFIEVQTEWETPEATVNDEIGGWAGVLTLAVDEGTPDAEGLRPDGRIGGFLTATSGADTLVVSFTVPVVEYEKDE